MLTLAQTAGPRQSPKVPTLTSKPACPDTNGVCLVYPAPDTRRGHQGVSGSEESGVGGREVPQTLPAQNCLEQESPCGGHLQPALPSHPCHMAPQAQEDKHFVTTFLCKRTL
ncbi:hypothetical protein DPEC_G00373710 [Dallia pectoralis]|nr:hypothetical protein DPEC_G00373710 [Dallia pectoralis]